MIALDTNLLVYAHRAGSPMHEEAKDAILQAIRHKAGWGIATSCLAEFWAVVTHPVCQGGPSSPDQAQSFIQQLIEDGSGQLWESLMGFGARLLQRACDLNISGSRIFDLQIALMAHENGATEIWTHDQQFIRLPGLKVVHPFK